MCTLGPSPHPQKMHVHRGPYCLPPGIMANSVESLRCGSRRNNVIFMRGDMGCPPHYHSAVMNGIFCPRSHERTRHPPVAPNWLFTVFQHGRIFHRPRFVVLSDAATNLSQKFPRSCYIFYSFTTRAGLLPSSATITSNRASLLVFWGDFVCVMLMNSTHQHFDGRDKQHNVTKFDELKLPRWLTESVMGLTIC